MKPPPTKVAHTAPSIGGGALFFPPYYQKEEYPI